VTELSVAVLIPALNEEEALPATLAAIPRGRVNRIVVVDNGSRDRTREVAREGGAVVVEESRRGYGAACLAGMQHMGAWTDPPDIIVFVDGDAGGSAEHLDLLLDPIISGVADLVLGTRRTVEASAHSPVPLHARMGNRLVLTLVHILFGRRFEDFAPFRAIRTDSLDLLSMDDRDWGWTLQMQVRAVRHALRIEEVPIPHSGRRAGRSKISGTLSGSIRAGSKMLYTAVRERFRTA